MCKFAERATLACWLVGAITVPVLVMPMIYGGYGLPKAVLLQVLTVLVIAAWMLGMASPTGSQRKSPGASSGSSPSHLGSVFNILRSPVALAGLGFLTSQLLATACSLSPRISFWGGHGRWQGAVANLCGYIVMLTLPLGARSRKDVEAMISAVLWGSAIVVAVGFAQSIWPAFPIRAWASPRIGSTLGNPIFLGGYLVLVIPLAVVRWIKAIASFRWRRSPSTLLHFVAYAVLLAGQAVCLWFTGSRGPWLGAAGAGLVFCILLGWRRHRPRLVIACLIVLVGVGALLLLLNMSDVSLRVAEHVPFLGRLRFARDSGSISQRILVWRATWDLILRRPAIGVVHDAIGWLRHIVGYGPETTQFTFWTVFPLELFYHSGSEGLFDRVHNRLLEVTLTSGVVGVLTYLVFMVTLGVCLIRHLKSEESLRGLLLPLALLSAVVGHFLELQTGIEQIETQTLLWVYAGLVITLSRRDVRAEVSGDNAQGASPVEVPLGFVAIRWKVVGYTVFAVALSVLLVVATSLRGGRQIAAASLYMAARDFHPDVSDSLRLDLLNRTVALAPYEPLYYRAKFTLHYRLAQRVPDADIATKSDVLQFGADAIEQAITLAPYERLYHINRAEIYGYWAASIAPVKLHEAVESWKRTIELTPWDVGLRVSLGELYLETGHLEDARQVLLNAIELDPLNGESYYVLGLVYRELGQEELAREQFEIGYSVDSGCSECESELRSPDR